LCRLLKYTHSGSKRDFNIALGIAIVYVLAGFVINDSWAARFIRLIFVGALFAAQRYGYETRRLVNIGVLAVAFSYVGYLVLYHGAYP
jgi:hypothetical protein